MSKKILLIEDDTALVDVLKMGLEQEGYDIAVAYQGKEALAMLDDPKNRFDLIVLDLILPLVDGVTINQNLKSKPETQYIPVLVISGADQLKEKFALIEGVSVSAYLEKPFSVKIFISKIKDLFLLSGQK
jgi:DNA-binding response OmpR family regulator